MVYHTSRAPGSFSLGTKFVLAHAFEPYLIAVITVTSGLDEANGSFPIVLTP